jgi:lysophospholipid acyltransferase (LPLAT)-like uncharacterized protein
MLLHGFWVAFRNQSNTALSRDKEEKKATEDKQTKVFASWHEILTLTKSFWVTKRRHQRWKR